MSRWCLLFSFLNLVLWEGPIANAEEDPANLDHIEGYIHDPGTGSVTQLHNYGKLHAYNPLEKTAIGRAMRVPDDEPHNRMGFYLKDKQQVDQYFKNFTCHRPEVLDNYKKKYKNYYMSAATAFELPYALGVCIPFRETFFQEGQVSRSGAKSTSQFLRPTYNDLRDQITKILDIPDCKRKWCSATNKKLVEGVRKILKMHGKSDSRPPREFDNGTARGDFVSDPMWVSILTMYYLKQNAMRMDIAFQERGNKKGRKFNQTSDVLLYPVVLACSYNAGPRRAIDAFQSPATTSIKKVCDVCANNSAETRNYMLSVRRCMLQNAFDAPTGYGNHLNCNNVRPTPMEQHPCEKVYIPMAASFEDYVDPELLQKNSQ